MGWVAQRIVVSRGAAQMAQAVSVRVVQIQRLFARISRWRFRTAGTFGRRILERTGFGPFLKASIRSGVILTELALREGALVKEMLQGMPNSAR